MIVTGSTSTPRSCIISARSRSLMPYLQYQRTHTRMISTGKQRRLNITPSYPDHPLGKAQFVLLQQSRKFCILVPIRALIPSDKISIELSESLKQKNSQLPYVRKRSKHRAIEYIKTHLETTSFRPSRGKCFGRYVVGSDRRCCCNGCTLFDPANPRRRLGLSSISVWSNAGASTSTIGTASILWFILTEITSSAMGGYLPGRLRTKWTAIHGDEVYFRDTAHGFLSWSAALVVTAALLGSAATAAIGFAPPSETASATRITAGTNAYFIYAMLRTDNPKAEDITPRSRWERYWPLRFRAGG
jgi:hypothetical protein